MNDQPLHLNLRQYIRWFGRQGLVFYIRAVFLAQKNEVNVKFRHVRVPVTMRLNSSDFGFYYQIMIRNTYNLSLKHPPRVIVDAGANIGLASVYFANRYPQARIYALEPESSNFALLCKNSAAYPQITPIRAALWNEITQLDVTNPKGRHGAFRTQMPLPQMSPPIIDNVKSVTMSQLLAEERLEFIDILKVDIEGAEKNVFSDAGPWIDRVGIIIAELHDRFRRGCSLSFYNATQGFEVEWHAGEHVFVARRSCITKENIEREMSL